MDHDLRARAAMATIGLAFAFNPHQRRGPDGRWLKMPTNELKRPRRAKDAAPEAPQPPKTARKPRAKKTAAAQWGDDDRPPIRIEDAHTIWRKTRDEYNDNVLSYADTMLDQGWPARPPDPELKMLVQRARQTPQPQHDTEVDVVRALLDRRFDGKIGLDRPPGAARDTPLPVLPPGRRTNGGPRPAVSAPQDQRRAALDESIRSGLDSQEILGGGQMGDTRRVRLADGTEAIYKRARASIAKWSKRDQTDAEVLAASVADAIGMRAPAVLRVDDENLYMEVMPGRPGAWADRIQDHADTDMGRRMGLLDALLANPDRHSGNWLSDEQGNISAIDHGLAFNESGTPNHLRGDFSKPFYRGGTWRDGNPLSDADIGYLRGRLKSKRPEFEALGRGAWLNQALRRLKALASHTSVGPGMYSAERAAGVKQS